MSAWSLSAAGVGPLGFILVALMAVIGALAIHALRRRKTGGSVARVAVPEDSEIAARLREVAARMGLPERVLPRACPPDGDGDFVWREGEGYRYQSLERGGPVADHAAPTLDEILYAVFRDRTRMHGYIATIGTDEATRETRIAEQQRTMLAAADPAWAAKAQVGV